MKNKKEVKDVEYVDKEKLKEEHDDKVKEEKVKENVKAEKVNTKQKPKKDSDVRDWLILILIIVILSIVGFLIFNHFKGNDLPFTDNDTSKIELNHTQVSDDEVKGVYITDVSEVVENVMPSIVAITSKTLVSTGRFGPSFFGYGQEQYSEGAGSGIIISKTNDELLILTNNHVVEGAKELTVQFIDNNSVDANIKGVSERRDVAVISIKLNAIKKETLKAIKIATIGKSDELKVGNGVIAIGNALGYGQSVTTGVVSALNREVTIDNYTTKMIQIDAAINGGNSGGALLNSKGEVVGINSAKYSAGATLTNASVEGMGFAIPISDIESLITSLMNGEEEVKPVIGVEGYMTSESFYNLPTGFYISKIVEGSGADKAGLEIGNIITEIEGKKVKVFSDLSDVLYDKKVGDKITLKIKYVDKREYKEKEVKVTLSK